MLQYYGHTHLLSCSLSTLAQCILCLLTLSSHLRRFSCHSWKTDYSDGSAHGISLSDQILQKVLRRLYMCTVFSFFFLSHLRPLLLLLFLCTTSHSSICFFLFCFFSFFFFSLNEFSKFSNSMFGAVISCRDSAGKTGLTRQNVFTFYSSYFILYYTLKKTLIYPTSFLIFTILSVKSITLYIVKLVKSQCYCSHCWICNAATLLLQLCHGRNRFSSVLFSWLYCL